MSMHVYWQDTRELWKEGLLIRHVCSNGYRSSCRVWFGCRVRRYAVQFFVCRISGSKCARTVWSMWSEALTTRWRTLPIFFKKGSRCQQGPSPSYSDPLLCGCVVESTSCDSCSAGKPEIPPLLFLRLGFSWFWVVRFMILTDFRGPGAHFGDLGAHFEDISDFCDF